MRSNLVIYNYLIQSWRKYFHFKTTFARYDTPTTQLRLELLNDIGCVSGRITLINYLDMQ